VTDFLNTNRLCSEDIHCAKSNLENLDNFLAIVGSDVKV
jgi:hypothetical protein